MPGTSFAAIKQAADNRKLVRKVLQAVAFLAPTSVDLPASLTDESGALQALPTGFWPVGLVTPDGYTFAADTTKEDVDALGYVEPVRSDITKIARTVEFTALETYKRNLQGLIHGRDMSTVTPAATSGEIVFDDPSMPTFDEFRLIIIGQDGPATEEWLMGRGYPLVKLKEIPEEVWKSSDPTQSKISLDVFSDPTLGTPCRNYLAGTGAKKNATALGYGA